MKKSSLSIKYRQKDLLPVGSFISFCETYGIVTNKAELEYFEKQQLLLPAARVSRGYLEYRKILPEEGEWSFVHKDDLKKVKYKEIESMPYYCSAGFSITSENWLDYYIKNNMVQDPALSKFRPWEEYGKYQTFTTNIELFEDDYEQFYSVMQIYPLAFLVKSMTVSFKDESLFATKEQWVKSGQHVSDFMNNLVDTFVRPKTKEYVRLINLIAEIKVLLSPINKRTSLHYKRQLKTTQDTKQAALEASDLRNQLFKAIGPRAKILIDSSGMSIEELSDKRLLILEAGTFSKSSKTFELRKAYLKKLSEEDLVDAENPYKDASFINRFLEILGEPYLESKQLLLSTRLAICEICASQFIRKKKNQVTCASPVCKRAHNRNYKKEKRKTNPRYGI